MKQKMSIVLDAEIVRLAKKRAAKEQRTLSGLIQEALVKHLRKDAAMPTERKMAYHLFCERPMKIPLRQLRYILKEDVWSL
jgi:hypothetical protein